MKESHFSKKRRPGSALIRNKKTSKLSRYSSSSKHFMEGLKSTNRTEIMQALLEKGHITEEELSNMLGKEFGLEVIKNLHDYTIPHEVLNLVPQKICEKNIILPLVKIDKTLVVVFYDPSDINLKDNLSLITGCTIQAVVSTKTEIKKAFTKYFNSSEMIDNLVYDMSFEVAGFEEELAIDLDKEHNERDPVISFVNLMFTDAIRLHSSDIHVECYEKSFRIRYRIDGILHEKHNLSKDMSSLIISRIKVMSGMDISEKRKPQDARLKIQLGGTELNMRISSTPTINGEKLVLRVLDDSSLQEDMTKLGMESFQMKMFKEALFSPQGLILLTGPTGSGKTTTIYSGLMSLNTPKKNISTAEDPVEFKIHGINQVQMNPKAGVNFASILRSFLRQDPDVILVGEIRDLETAEIAFKASATGHLVLSTVHTNDTSSTITRLLTMGVPSYSVADNTSLIVAQRLLRRLCDQCRLIDTTSNMEKLEQDMELTHTKSFHSSKIFKRNPEGCNYCNQLGYKGRLAVYELMKITKTIRMGIFNKISPIELKKVAIEEDGLVSLRQSALLKVKQGLTSIEEVIRGTVL